MTRVLNMRIFAGFGLALCFLGTSHAALIAHYTLEEGSGSSVGDATTNGNGGTAIGTYSWDGTDAAPVPGGSTYSLQLNNLGNANNGYADLPEGDATEPDTDLFIDGSFTLAAWVKFDDYSSGAGAAKIVGSYQTSSPFAHNYLLRIFQSDHSLADTVGFIARDQSGDTVTLADDITPTTDVWYHYAVSFDDTDGATTLYRDGNEVDTGTLANFNGFGASSQIVSLGDADSQNHDESKNFNGKLDDVRIYDEVLQPSEIHGLAIPEPAAFVFLLLGCLVTVLGRRPER